MKIEGFEKVEIRKFQIFNGALIFNSANLRIKMGAYLLVEGYNHLEAHSL